MNDFQKTEFLRHQRQYQFQNNKKHSKVWAVLAWLFVLIASMVEYTGGAA